MKKLLCLALSLIIFSTFCLTVNAENRYDLPDVKTSLSVSADTVMPGKSFLLSFSVDNASAYPSGIAAFTAMMSYDHSAFNINKVSYAVSKADIMSNSSNGTFKSLYCFVSPDKKPGFNTDGVFYTAQIEVLENAEGKYDFSLDFDAISVMVYGDNSVDTVSLGFNKPTVSVTVTDDIHGSSSDVLSGDTHSTAPIIDKADFEQIKDEDSPYIENIDSNVVVSEMSSTVSGSQSGSEIPPSPGSGSVQTNMPISGMSAGTQEQNSTLTENATVSDTGTTVAESNDLTQKDGRNTVNFVLIIVFIIILLAIIAVIVIIILNRKKHQN